MIKRIALFPVFCAALGFASCSDGIGPFLTRLNRDPEAEKPKVLSFSQPNAVIVSWNEDHAVDTFVLERAVDANVDPDTLVFTEIYRGADLSFVDVQAEVDVRYLYRLSKTRGSEIFVPTIIYAGVGVNCPISADSHEPNDDKEHATTLDVPRMSASFFYKGVNGDIIQDVDWYVFTVPAHMTAQITVEEEALPPYTTIITGATRFMYQIHETGYPPMPVTHTAPFELVNYDNTPFTFHIKIMPQESVILDITSVCGGSPIAYKIHLEQLYYNSI